MREYLIDRQANFSLLTTGQAVGYPFQFTGLFQQSAGTPQHQLARLGKLGLAPHDFQ